MSPATFTEISRVARLAVLSSIFTSFVADDVDANPDVTTVLIRGDVLPDGDFALSLQYVDDKGFPIAEVSL